MKSLKQLSLYTFVGFFNAGIGFLLMPYLSHFIEPAGYGILSMVNSLVTILIPIVGLTAAGLISVEYYRMKDKSQFASLFSSVQLIPVVPGIFIILLSLFFSKESASFLEIPIDKAYWIPFSVVIALLSIYFETLLVYNVIQQNPKAYVLFSLIKLLVEVGLTLLFVSGFKLGWEGRLYSWFITTLVTFFIALYYFKDQKLLTLKIKSAYIKAGILFGLPLILHNIGKFVINQSDRVFIAKMVSIDEAGIYNIGYTIGTIVMIIVNAFFNFYSPFLMERLADLTEERKIQIVKMGYLYFVGCILMLLLIDLLSPLFFSWFIDPQYASGVKYVFWVALGYCFWGGYMLFSGFIFFYKRNAILAWLAVINVVSNLFLNYIFIIQFGAIGAAYATALSFFFVMVIVKYKVRQLVKLPWLDVMKKSNT